MLSKNIYLLYPPGYSGSYVSWCISKSEESLAPSTVDNPVNTASTGKYGGYGTSHLHHRIPTHQNIHQIIAWIILNKPIENKIYLVNFHNEGYLGYSIHHIMNFDRDPVFIQISATKTNAIALAKLNAITKWPLYFQVAELDKKFNIDLDSADLLELRNKFVKHYDTFFPSSMPLDFDKEFDYIENINEFRKQYKNWYTLRNSYNSHEVNESYYAKPKDKPDYFYNIDLLDIFQENFPNKLHDIMNDCNAGSFNFDYVKKFHQTYIDAQTNLKILNELNEFKKTKIVTDYLTSHPLIEALIIKDLLNELPNDYNWEQETLQEIVKVLQSQ
jgi:hypothetical protein